MMPVHYFQPFHYGTYYPYTGDTHGTHSSAWIQSLLNCPLSHYSVPAARMTPASDTSTVPPFKFRRRWEKVNWRRFNKVDINLVKSQVDIDTLQNHITEVTFCSLDGERCQECRSPVDPDLLKLLQLAQLSVEWLLHCQEVFSLNQRAVEEKLEAALKEQKSEPEEKVKALKEELGRKGKVVRDLESQLLLCSHKCGICKKGFFTPQFLHNHMERRHPEDHESRLQADSKKKAQIKMLKLENSRLREQNIQLQLSLDIKTAQEKHLEIERDFYKAEVMLHQKNEHPESAKNKLLDELSTIQSSVSGEKERSQQLLQEMEQRLRKMQQTIEAQMEQLVNILSEAPTIEVDEPVVVSAPAPEPKPLNVEPIEEPSEDKTGLSSASEPEQSPSVRANALKRNPSMEKEIGRALEQVATNSLEDLGVKPNQSGVNNTEYTSILAKVHSERDNVSKGMTGYWQCQEMIACRADDKMREITMKEDPPETQSGSGHLVQGSETLSGTLVSGPEDVQSETPQPAPRAESPTQPETATPNSKAAPKTFHLMETGNRMAKWFKGTSRKIRKSLSLPKRWSRSFKVNLERDQQEASS